MSALTGVLEIGFESGTYVPPVKSFMTRELVTLSPEIDVFAAIDQLLQKRISGAPVINGEGKYQGVFSEKTAMQALIAAVYDQLPGT